IAAIAGVGTERVLPVIRSDHDLMSLIKAIRMSFPVVCRLMNDRSDCDAIHEYVRDNAAIAGALLDCGESFPRCLEQFPAADIAPFCPIWRGWNGRGSGLSGCPNWRSID